MASREECAIYSLLALRMVLSMKHSIGGNMILGPMPGQGQHASPHLTPGWAGRVLACTTPTRAGLSYGAARNRNPEATRSHRAQYIHVHSYTLSHSMPYQAILYTEYCG